MHRGTIAQSTPQRIIKRAIKVDAILNDNVGSGDQKRIQCSTYGSVEAAQHKWFIDARGENILLSRSIMLAKARDLGFALGHDDFKPGNRWVQRFKERHGIMCKNIVGEAAFVDNESLQ